MRKPIPMRWSEEADANHVREWAELERSARNKAVRAGLTPRQLRPQLLFSRLLSRFRDFFRRQHA